MSLREQLHGIYDRRGELTPALVVEEARPLGAPLHERFEWDDALAAEAHRRTQASALIRSVQVVYAREADGTNRHARAFLSVRADDAAAASYAPAEQVMADPFTARLVLRECSREIARLRVKYGHLEGFAAMLAQEAAS